MQWRSAVLGRAQEQGVEPMAIVEEMRPYIQPGKFPAITHIELAELMGRWPYTHKQLRAAFGREIS